MAVDNGSKSRLGKVKVRCTDTPDGWDTVDRLSAPIGDYVVTRTLAAQRDARPSQHAAWRCYHVLHVPTGRYLIREFSTVRTARTFARALANDARLAAMFPRSDADYEAAWEGDRAKQRRALAYVREALAVAEGAA